MLLQSLQLRLRSLFKANTKANAKATAKANISKIDNRFNILRIINLINYLNKYKS